ncbi:calcium-binding protein 4-like [Diretmus argenteus]
MGETADMLGLKELQPAFVQFDTDGDGKINQEEMKEAVKTMLWEKLKQSPNYNQTAMGKGELEEILKELDINADGNIDFEASGPPSGLPPYTGSSGWHAHLPQTGQEPTESRFDTDGDGKINQEEMKEAVKTMLGEKLKKGELEEILKELDINADGNIDFEEFVMMLSIH